MVLQMRIILLFDLTRQIDKTVNKSSKHRIHGEQDCVLSGERRTRERDQTGIFVSIFVSLVTLS